MNVPTATRSLDGRFAPGHSGNAGGRPRNGIEELRQQYMHRLPEFLNVLIELTHSQNETIRLQATRELLDRLTGKPTVVVDSTHARVDVGQLYLAALRRANQPAQPREPGDHS